MIGGDMTKEVFDKFYRSPDGLHRHKCSGCDHVWEHSDSCAYNESAHKCPKCGAEEWCKYFGPEAPKG